MDWKGFDKLVCDDLGEEKLNENLMKEKETTIQILKKIDPKTIKFNLKKNIYHNILFSD